MFLGLEDRIYFEWIAQLMLTEEVAEDGAFQERLEKKESHYSLQDKRMYIVRGKLFGSSRCQGKMN